MTKIKILLVEDEETLAMIIKDTLEAQGFAVTTAADGEEGVCLVEQVRPDVVVADVMMPRMDGFEMVRRIRKHGNMVPVLFLTARSAVNDVVEGFHLGANDYLRKPFGMQELIVRIEALAGRSIYGVTAATPIDDNTVTIGRFRLDVVRQQLMADGRVQSLSYRETELLHILAAHANDVVETQHILLKLWGDDTFFNARSLQVFMTKLRHKLSSDSSLRIVNVRGVGYKLVVG